MPRSARVAPGGMLFRVLNRGVGADATVWQVGRLRGVREHPCRDARNTSIADLRLLPDEQPLAFIEPDLVNGNYL